MSTTDTEAIIKAVLATNDYYKVLDVAKDCQSAAIKKQYRKLALLLHPDKCSLAGAEDAFKKVSSAYNCLSNEEQRKMYDMTGSEGPPGGGPGGMGGHPFHGGGHMDPNEIFRQFFAQQGMDGGDDLFAQMFANAARGGGGGGFQGFAGPGIRVHTFGGGLGGGHPFFNIPQQRRRQRPNSATNDGGDIDDDERGSIPTQFELPSYLKFLSVVPQYIPAQLLLPIGLFCGLYAASILLQNISLVMILLIFAPRHTTVPVLLALVVLNALGLWDPAILYITKTMYKVIGR